MKNPGKIEGIGDLPVSQPLLPLDIHLLAGQVTFVFGVVGHLPGDFGDTWASSGRRTAKSAH